MLKLCMFCTASFNGGQNLSGKVGEELSYAVESGKYDVLFSCFRVFRPYTSDTFLTGVKVEGILRQSADVEEVKQRIEEFEQGLP